jgi:hypothetical protein
MLGLAAPRADADSSDLIVDVLDRCDPASFNAVLGEGSCVPTPNGNVTFDEFINAFPAGHPAWKFLPRFKQPVPSSKTFKAKNLGGEFHTFSEVAKFGPGCIPEINELMGLRGAPVVDCSTVFDTTGLPPAGGTLVVGPLSPGKHFFMCAIHPWQKTSVKVV